MAHPAQITIVKGAKIGDAIFQHRNPFNPHTKSKSLIFFWIIAAIFQNAWIDHARSENFQPIITSTNFQRTIIAGTANINFGGWLGKGKIAWPKPHRQIINAKKGTAEINQTAFEMPHMNAVANDQPFTLMKHRRMCGVMVRPIGAPGNNDADWWLIGLHGPDLHWRSMRAKHLAFAIGVGWQVERVMLLTGGVFGR